MAELIHNHSTYVRTPDGEIFRTRVYGERQADGLWIGWLEFDNELGRTVWRTERETTQPNRDALDYWASGLEPIYIEGAFARAQAVAIKSTRASAANQ